MRILFCNYEYPPLGGGGGVINSLLAEELAKRHEVTVLTSRGKNLPAETVDNGVRIIRVPVFFRRQEAVANLVSMLMFIPMGIKFGRKLLQTNHYDVINTHFVLPTGPVGDALSRFAGIPNVLTLHGGDLYDPSKFFSPHRYLLLRTWIKRILRRSDLVIGQSTNTLNNMRRIYTPEIEGVQIPLGIQRPLEGAAVRESYGFKEDDVLLVTVGRLIVRKAIIQLIEMMDIVREEKVHLLVIGIGPQEGFLKEQTLKRKLGDRVLFTGLVEESEKFRILRMCDVYVSSSQHEGFGLVFLEAMACGLPVVCYDHGGQTDFLKNAVTGYLLPLNDFRGFADRCRHLIQNSELRTKFGQENIRRVQELFIDRCAQRYEEVFQEAITCCQIETLVSLSSAKKLPVGVVESKMIIDGKENRLTVASLGGVSSQRG